MTTPAPTPASPVKARKGLKFWALLLSIVALVFSFIPFVSIASFLLGPAAIVLAALGIRKEKATKKVRPIVAIVLSALAIIIAAALNSGGGSSKAADEPSSSVAPSESAPATQAATKPSPTTVPEPAKESAQDEAKKWGDAVYEKWLQARGVKSATEILAQNPASIPGTFSSHEAPSVGTLIITAQVTKATVDKSELKDAAMNVMNLAGYEDESLTRVEVVTADSLVRGVYNRHDSVLLNK